jgi:hypothetical protein
MFDQKSELDTPTKAPAVPKKIKRRNSFSVMNATQGSEVHLHQTEHPAACPPRTVFPVNQGSRMRSFTHGCQLAFGKGCDRSSHVNPFYQLDLTRATSNTAFD